MDAHTILHQMTQTQRKMCMAAMAAMMAAATSEAEATSAGVGTKAAPAGYMGTPRGAGQRDAAAAQ